MKSKHTPGPWHTGAGNGEGWIFGPEGTRRTRSGLAPICKMNGKAGEDEANARLIAKAPEMAALISDVFRDINGMNATMRATSPEYNRSALCRALDELVKKSADLTHQIEHPEGTDHAE